MKQPREQHNSGDVSPVSPTFCKQMRSPEYDKDKTAKPGSNWRRRGRWAGVSHRNRLLLAASLFRHLVKRPGLMEKLRLHFLGYLEN